MDPTKRATLVMRTVTATLNGDSSIIAELFSVDVSGALPLPMSCAAAFAVEIEDRAGVFADVETSLVRERSAGATTYVEWYASMVHVGVLASRASVAGGGGERVEVRGITVADFEDDRIHGFRQYWDFYDRLLVEDLTDVTQPLPD